MNNDIMKDMKEKNDLKILGRKIADKILERVDMEIGFRPLSEEELDNIGLLLEELISEENVSEKDRRFLAFYAGQSTADLLFERSDMKRARNYYESVQRYDS
jgi:hypothetical protein